MISEAGDCYFVKLKQNTCKIVFFSNVYYTFYVSRAIVVTLFNVNHVTFNSESLVNVKSRVFCCLFFITLQ